MHEGYKKYLDALASKNMKNPMSEKEWKKAIGIKEEEQIQFVSRKSTGTRNIEPTLANHTLSKRSSNPQLKINLLDVPRPDVSQLLEVLEKRLKEKGSPPKPEAVTPPTPQKQKYRPPKIYTDEDIKQRRLENVRAKRKAFQEQGLTIRGKPYAQPKQKKSIEELRADRLKYAKKWRANNREEWLSYRRELRKRKKSNEVIL